MSPHSRVFLTASINEPYFVATAPPPQLVKLSEDSLIVRSDEILEPGEFLPVTVRFVETGKETSFLAEVVSTNRLLGRLRLRIVKVSPEGLDQIQQYCEKIEAPR